MENDYGDKGVRSTATPATASASSNSSLLAALNQEMFRRLAPAVAVLVILMVVGALGNVCICYIFVRKLRSTSQNLLLLSLGAFDLLSICVGVPSEIFDLRHYFLYRSAEACKAMRFLTTFPSLASILVLLVIAVDRYKKICMPLRPQIGVKHIRVSVVVIVVVALIFSVPALYIYGHRSLPTPVHGLYGYDCSVDDAFKNRPYPLVYEGLFLVVFSLFAVSLVCIYLRIWLETRRHIEYLKTHATFGTGMLEEATTTTSTVNYDDSSLENIADDNSRPGSRKTSRKSHHKKQGSSRKIKPGSKRDEAKQAMLPGGHPSIRFVSGGIAQHTNGGPDGCKYTRSDSNDIDEKGGACTKFKDVVNPPRVLGDTTEAARAMLSTLSRGNLDAPEVVVLQESPRSSRKMLGSLPLGSLDAPRDKVMEDCTSSVVNSHKLVPEDVEGDDSSHLDRNECIHSPADSHSSLSTIGGKSLDSHAAKPNPSESNQDEPLESPVSLPDSRDKRGGSRQTSLRLAKTKRRSSEDLRQVSLTEGRSLTASVRSRRSLRADSSRELVRDKESDRSRSSQNGTKHSSVCLPLCESNKSRESPVNDTTCSDCRSFPADMSQRDSKRFLTTGGHNCQSEPKENTVLVSHQENQHSIIQPKKSLSFTHQISNQSDIKLEKTDNKTDQSLPFSLTNQMRGSNYSKSSQSVSLTKKARKALSGTRTTIIAFAITIGFIISYLPHLTLILLRSVMTDFEHNLDDVSLVFYNIFLRSYFVNNVVNVFVYGTMNLQFRSEILNLCKIVKSARR